MRWYLLSMVMKAGEPCAAGRKVREFLNSIRSLASAVLGEGGSVRDPLTALTPLDASPAGEAGAKSTLTRCHADEQKPFRGFSSGSAPAPHHRATIIASAIRPIAL
jgi:hypothetical protein